jgi:hypothetical protein
MKSDADRDAQAIQNYANKEKKKADRQDKKNKQN